jgi:hypothetical protein
MNARPLMRLRFTTAATEEIGQTPHGMLSIFPITGGSFEGERLRGIVLGGADWVTAGADGTRDANHYFRTLPRFETAAPQYAFLNRLLAVGVGEGHRDGPVHTIEEIL